MSPTETVGTEGGVTEPFDSARDLVSWAREDAKDLESAITEFFANEPYTKVMELDSEADHEIHKIRIAPVPNKLRKLASHAMWDLKHALDHAINAAILGVTGTVADDVHFPWCSHPSDLEGRFRHRSSRYPYGKYPPELWDILRMFEPYPTGNGYSGGSNELCALSKLANASKHAVALAAAPSSSIHRFSMERSGGLIRAFPNKWDSSKQELTIGHFVRNSYPNVQLSLACHVGFRDVDALKGWSVDVLLLAVADVIETMVTQLEREVAVIHMNRAGLPLHCIPRPAGWVPEVEQRQS